MNLPVKKKQSPMDAAISLIGKDGDAGTFIGNTTLHIVHTDGPLAWVHGKILDDAGAVVGSVSIDGIPLRNLPSARPGRPKDEEKHLAVLLAWALNSAKCRSKFALADEKTAEQFGYSDGKKIRDIRNRLAQKYGLNLDKNVFHISDVGLSDGEIETSAFIPKPTYYLTESGGFLILGKGVAWHEKLGSHLLQGALKLTIPAVDPSGEIGELIAKNGPVVVVTTRTG